MKNLLAAAITFLLAGSVFPQQSDHTMKMNVAEKPATLMSGMGSHHHPVSTTEPEAQRFFDQGLSFVYAFNHDEAVRSFKRASELEPRMAMAHWGVALALGPNINLDVDPEREKAAYEAVQKALALAANAPENERAYIEALAKRYSIDPKADLKKLAVDYKNAMGELVKRYPDDLDAATLSAEAGMDLRPWQLWSADGKPAEGTEEIVAVLESVLKRDPDHVGAIHYYVHAVEASKNPERALAYAPKLTTLVPAAGHLVHMPAHIYQRVGDYHSAARSNREAAAADEAYIKINGVKGLYPLMYYSHNLHFEAYAHGMSGRFADAMSVAKKLEGFIEPHTKTMPMVEGFMPTPLFILVRFHKWDDILKLPKPDASLRATTAFWHFGRAMAFAAKGHAADAASEQATFTSVTKTVAADAHIGLNKTGNVLKIAERVLEARIARANRNPKLAIEFLRKAVVAEDSLAYDEPPGWFIPVRESLATALLRSGNHAEAEKTFREDLERNKRNGRSLFGLAQALKAQNKTYSAMLVGREFASAWKNADIKLNLEDQ